MGVLAAWLAEIGIITWRDLTGKDPTHTINGFPLPADYLATFVVFGALGLVPSSNQGAARAATLAAWAFVIATYMNALPTALNPSGAAVAKSATPGTASPTATPSSTIQSGG
jgi:hypothetical protein